MNQKLISLEFGKNITKKQLSLTEVIFDIERRAIRLSKKTSLSIMLFLDDIDADYDNSKKYISSIKSLITATESINGQFRNLMSKSKVLLLLRTDILNKMNGPNIGKIKRDAKIEIEWPTRITLSTPVVKMLIHKIRKSYNLPPKFSNDDIYHYFFPEKVKGVDAYKYILDRTMIRPRDAISYLKFIVDDYKEETKITSRMIQDVEGKYSAYLKEEIKNEMYGTFSEEYIESIFRLLKLLRMDSFSYEHIKIAFDQYRSALSIDNIDQCLSDMFEYGIIGHNTPKGFNFKYRDLDSSFAKTEQIILHPGLVKDVWR